MLFCRKKVFAPARWWPLLGLFEPKIPAEVATDLLKPFTTPYPILDLGSGLKPPQNKHADARA